MIRAFSGSKRSAYHFDRAGRFAFLRSYRVVVNKALAALMYSPTRSLLNPLCGIHRAAHSAKAVS